MSPTGDVWAVTSGGLVRWDPADGTYTEIRDVSWPDPAPSTIAFTPDGDLWLGFYTYVVRWDDGRSTIYEFTPQGMNWGVIQLAVGPDGRMWAGAEQLGIHRFDAGRWEVVEDDLPGRGDLDTFTVDADGRPWVGTFWSGLWVLEDQHWWQEHTWPVPVVSAADNGDVWYVVRDLANETDAVVQVRGRTDTRTEYPMGLTSVWEIAPVGDAAYVGTNPRPPDVAESERHGLWHLADGMVEAIPGAWDDIGRQILGVAVRSDGDVWLGGEGGVWRFDGAAARHYATDTYAGFSVGFLVAADENVVWAGDCQTSSLRRDVRWEALPQAPEGLDGCAAVIDHAGTLWLAGMAGIARLDGDRWVLDWADASGTAWADLYPTCGSEACDEPKWALEGVDGEMWAGIIGIEDGLWHYREGAWRRVAGALPPGFGGVVDLAAGNDGSLWVATRHGAHELADGRWTHWPSGEGGPPDLITSFGVGGGVVWAGTHGEVVRFDGHEWTSHLDSEWYYDGGPLLVDEAGGIWRNSHDGPRRFDGVTTFDLDLPFTDEEKVSRMAITPDGSWWLAHGASVYRWTPAASG